MKIVRVIKQSRAHQVREYMESRGWICVKHIVSDRDHYEQDMSIYGCIADELHFEGTGEIPDTSAYEAHPLR
jgi:hypothetical protein